MRRNASGFCVERFDPATEVVRFGFGCTIIDLVDVGRGRPFAAEGEGGRLEIVREGRTVRVALADEAFEIPVADYQHALKALIGARPQSACPPSPPDPSSPPTRRSGRAL